MIRSPAQLNALVRAKEDAEQQIEAFPGTIVRFGEGDTPDTYEVRVVRGSAGVFFEIPMNDVHRIPSRALTAAAFLSVGAYAP
jgi:hypothetical protein